MPGDAHDRKAAAKPTVEHRHPVRATALALARESSAATAFSALLNHCSAHMLANETGLRTQRNPEYLHQFRVGLRRLRSALRIFRPLIATERYAALTADMRWLAGVLGKARDWDVFMAETLRPLLRCERAPGLAALRRRCALRRRRCAGAVRAAMASPRYEEFKQALESMQSAPAWSENVAARQRQAMTALEFAAQQIGRREKTVQRLAAGLGGADAEHRHRLRIAAKKLRYTVEFFRSLFEHKAARDYAAALAALQDALGQLNDCATARRLLDAVPAGHDAAADAAARAVLCEWILLREDEGRLALDAACAHWRRQPPYW